MARPTERLKEARPAALPTTLKMSRLSIQRMYARTRKTGIAQWNDGLDYAEYIHALWNTMLQSEDFKTEAKHLEDMLGQGDVIQILSDVVLDHRRAIEM